MHPITQYYLKKEAMIIPAGVGAYRASLSKDDSDLLKKEYGLDEDASLELRNAGRGLAGSIGGSLAGTLLGSVLGAGGGAGLEKLIVSQHKRSPLLKRLGRKFQRGELAMLGNVLGSLTGNIGGSIYGMKKMTDRYSEGKAQEIRDRDKQAFDNSDIAGNISHLRSMDEDGVLEDELRKADYYLQDSRLLDEQQKVNLISPLLGGAGVATLLKGYDKLFKYPNFGKALMAALPLTIGGRMMTRAGFEGADKQAPVYDYPY